MPFAGIRSSTEVIQLIGRICSKGSDQRSLNLRISSIKTTELPLCGPYPEFFGGSKGDIVPD